MKVHCDIGRLPAARWLGSVATALMVAITASSVHAASVTLAWDASADTTVTGYIVHYGVVGGTTTSALDVANQTTAVVPNLTAGASEFFYVTSYNAQRVESLPSNQITYTIPTTSNTAPTISSIANRTINEDSTTGPLALTVGDAETAAGSLLMSGVSSNPTLVPNVNIVFGGTGASRTVAVTPAPNQSGTTTITLTVSDGTASTSTSFTLTVNPVNDPPLIWGLKDLTISTSGSTGPLAFTVSDVETLNANLTVSASSSNPTLVPNANIAFGGSGSSRTVTVTPAAGQIGSATITVTVSDGTSTGSQSFLLTVTSGSANTLVYLPFEAEIGALTAPMAIASDSNAGQGDYIQTTVNESGTAAYTFSLPVSGNYVIWCRVLSRDGGSDSFYVSADGGAEVAYPTAWGVWTNTWRWTQVSPDSINPTVYAFATGSHTITFRGREANTGLDQILLTNDRNYVPDVVFSITNETLKLYPVLVDPTGSATLMWQSVPGTTYRILFKTDLSNPTWQQLGQDVKASDTITTKSDYLVGNRFYRVLALP